MDNNRADEGVGSVCERVEGSWWFLLHTERSVDI